MDGKLDTLQKSEIAEGVDIRLRVAGPTIRGFACLIDVIIQIAVYIIIAVAISMLALLSLEMYEGILMLSLFVIWWIYTIVFEASKLGATLGKLMLGLRVVQSSGAPLPFRPATIRNLLRIADFLPFFYGIGLVSCMCTRNFQRLGDLAADTVVIYKDPKIDPALLKMPLLHAQQAEPLVPTSPLTREEQEAIVKYADRVVDWSPERQQELAGHAKVLTRQTGPHGVMRLLGIAKWIRSHS